MKQDDDWTDEDGKLDKKLYYADQLHLVEAGNRKFACSILKILSKLMQDEKLGNSSDERKAHYLFEFNSNVNRCKPVSHNKPIPHKPVSSVCNPVPRKPVSPFSKLITRKPSSFVCKPVSRKHFSSIFSSNVCCSKPVSSSNVHNCKPVSSSNVRNCKPVSSSNVSPSKSVRSNTCNCSIKYRRNFLSLFLFVLALFWEFLLLGILVNNNFNFSLNNSFYNNTNVLSNNNFHNNTNFLYKTRSNILHNKHQNLLLSNCSYVFYTLLSFKPSYILNKSINFTNFANLFFDIYHYWKTLSNIRNFTESLFPITFFAIFGISVLKRLTLCSNYKSAKRTKLKSDTFSWIFDLSAHVQSIRFSYFSLFQYFSKFCFYMFEKFIDFLIFLDFLFLFIRGIFKYMCLSLLPLLIYLSFILTFIFNNTFFDHNILNNNFMHINIFLESSNESIRNLLFFNQEPTVSVSITNKNTITSYNPIIFYSVVTTFLCVFYKKHNFNFTKQFLPFVIFFFVCFNDSPPHEAKDARLKDCHKSNFFSIELIKITNSINSAEIHLDFCYFALSKLNFKKKKHMKFYQLLILLSGDISLNPDPCQYIPEQNKDLFKPFRKRGLHFLHINVNSLPSKIEELRNIVGHTKPVILGITESKLDSSIPDQEVNISGYSILRNDRNRNGGGVACYIRADLCFNRRNVFSSSIEYVFFDLLIPKIKPISIGIFYRPPNVNTFLETFLNGLKLIDFTKSEVYFLGDFNINLLQNNKFVLKENQPLDSKNLNSPLLPKYKELCQTFSLKEIIQKLTRVTSSTSSLLDHI